MQHGGQGVLRRYGVPQRGQRLPVGDVAGGEGHPGAGVGQFADEVGRAGRVRAAAGGQQQVVGALGGEPPGDGRADGAGGPGDQHRAGRLPGGAGAGRGVLQPAAVGTGPADDDLVLAAGVAEQRGQPGHGPRAGPGGQVDQAAPAAGVFQRGGPAEAPHRGLGEAGDGGGRSVGDGVAGDAPQRGGDPGIAEGLHEGGAWTSR
ncbi:hypothetical protein [Streptomyces flaveolus]|uniref:hypothetical protein n=1 Tax=Streptomyces flaveolus TaxID=67297 RepID=UPI003F541849